jgi:hypothetical protein
LRKVKGHQVVVRPAGGEHVQGVAIDKSTIWRLNAFRKDGLTTREREELIRRPVPAPDPH